MCTTTRINRMLQGHYLAYTVDEDHNAECYADKQIGHEGIEEIISIIGAKIDADRVMYVERVNMPSSVTIAFRYVDDSTEEYKINRGSRKYYELREFDRGDVA